MEGRPYRANHCWLFEDSNKEILAKVFGHLADSKTGLLSLALINPDCRQLARSYQFRVVTFDGSHRCRQGILPVLLSEAFKRRQNRREYGKTEGLSLGACIRKVIVNKEGGLRDLERRTIQNSQNDIEWLENHLKKYDRPSVYSIISSLPNLETAHLSDVAFCQSLLSGLVGSTVTSATLSAHATDICPRIGEGVSWPLTSLNIKLSAFSDSTTNASHYWKNILHLCSAHLLRLSISYAIPKSKDHTDGGASYWSQALDFDLRFPELCHLDLQSADLLLASALRSLLLTSTRLSYLRINYYTPILWKFMMTAGSFAALRTLVVYYDPPTPWSMRVTNLDLTFLEKNRQITSFALTCPASRGLFISILKRLSQCPRLEKLLMVWSAVRIHRKTLATLEEFLNAPLQELYLIMSEKDSMYWAFHHDEIRTSLSPKFPGLRRLVLSRWEWYFPHVAGMLRAPTNAIPEIEPLAEAAAYGQALPNLEEIRFEDQLFEIVRNGNGVRARLSTKRFDCPFRGGFGF